MPLKSIVLFLFSGISLHNTVSISFNTSIVSPSPAAFIASWTVEYFSDVDASITIFSLGMANVTSSIFSFVSIFIS